LEGTVNDENVVLVALDEPPNEIKANMKSFHFILSSVKIIDAVPDIVAYTKGRAIRDMGTVLDFKIMRDVSDIRRSKSHKAGEVSIHSVQKMLDQAAKELNEDSGEKYSRVVLDSLTALKLFSMEGEDRRIIIQSFMQFLAEMEATCLIVTQPPDPNEIETELLLARGEIRLHKWTHRNDSMKRGISIEKFRGSEFDDAIYPVEITEEGIVVKTKRHIQSKVKI
jgi:KaiC/GvpD/RAD55 family RecA-like ATPase